MAGSDECGWLRADDASATRSRTKMKDAAKRGVPVPCETVKTGLKKIPEERGVARGKPASSPLLKSAGDYSCGLSDARGEMVAQGPALPIHLGSMPDAVRAIVA